MISRKLMAVSMAAALLAAACSSSSPTQVPPGQTSGPVSGSGTTVMVKSIAGSNALVDGANGMTLYVFAKDSANSGKSACSGGCAATWPPLTVTGTPSAGVGASGTLGTITRDDGSKQVTYNGLPLYHYGGDHASGDTNGNYPGWSIAKP